MDDNPSRETNKTYMRHQASIIYQLMSFGGHFDIWLSE